MLELEKNWKNWRNLAKVLSTNDQKPITLGSFFARKIGYFFLEFQVWQKIANNTSGCSKANCPGLKFNLVDF